MPHRIGHLKERIVSLENVCAAAEDYNTARPRRLRKNFSIEWLNEIATDLANDRFVWDEPRRKDIYEGGKIRHLRIPTLRSSIAQCAIFRVISPVIDKRLPEMSYSSRKGKGGHALARKASRFIRTKRDKSRYCLYFDIRKYYDHINLETAITALRRIIKDEWVIRQVKGMFSNVGSGLPIGYVGAHQLANLYLAHTFRKMRTRERSVGFGSVYMDNFTFLGDSKRPLHRLRKYASSILGEIGLSLKGDWQVYRTDNRGVKIGGITIFQNGTPKLYRRINHRTMRAIDALFSRHTEKKLRGVASRYGWYLATGREHIFFDRILKEKKLCEQSIVANVLMNFN